VAQNITNRDDSIRSRAVQVLEEGSRQTSEHDSTISLRLRSIHTAV